MICEALTYNKNTPGLEWRDRFHRCRRRAAGTVYGIGLCRTHTGYVVFDRTLLLWDNREMTIAPDPKFVKADADGD